MFSAPDTILILLAGSALVGFVLGRNFSWPAIMVSGLLLAIISAVVLQKADFGALAGIATIVACLTVNQISYLVGAALVDRNPPGR
jgi:hypothetical protein